MTFFKLSNLLLFIGIVTSQFYVIRSGLPQPSHFILLIFSILVYWGLSLRLKINKDLTIFIFWICLINLSCGIYYQNTSFLIPLIQMVFVFILFHSLFTYLTYSKTYKILLVSYSAALIFLFIISTLSLGDFYYDTRYMAFFNDPNQMAFWVLCISCSFFMFYKETRISPYLVLLVFLISASLLLKTDSRSGMLGLLFVLFAVLTMNKRNKLINKIFLYSLITIFLLYLILAIDYSKVEVIKRFYSIDIESQLIMRGFLRIIEYPEFLIIGSGHGFHERFGTQVEIHSTWIGIAFYYGIIGIVLFAVFLNGIFKNLYINQKILFLAPLIYGVSTYGARTPIFWFFLATAAYISHLNKLKSNYENN